MDGLQANAGAGFRRTLRGRAERYVRSKAKSRIIRTHPPSDNFENHSHLQSWLPLEKWEGVRGRGAHGC